MNDKEMLTFQVQKLESPILSNLQKLLVLRNKQRPLGFSGRSTKNETLRDQGIGPKS